MRTLSICNVTFAVWAYAPHAENVEQIMNRKVNQHLICAYEVTKRV